MQHRSSPRWPHTGGTRIGTNRGRTATVLGGMATVLGLTVMACAPLYGQDAHRQDTADDHAPARTLEAEMQAAVEALPSELRSEAGLIRFGEGEEVVWVREPKNNLVCNLDDPQDSGFQVRCYHREMWAAVRHWQAVFDTLGGDRRAAYREFDRQVREGEFEMYTAPSVGYAMEGPDYSYDWESGAIMSEMAKWQDIYLPFATAEELGATRYREHSEQGLHSFMPFVQVPGTAFARITIQHEAW